MLDGAALTVVNLSGNDGMLEVIIADAVTSSELQVHLTGIPVSIDNGVFNVTSFNDAFGSGSLA